MTLLRKLLLTGSLLLSFPSDSFSESPNFTYDQFQPKIEYRNNLDKDHPKVKFLSSQIEKVPDRIQRFISNQGGKIIFFNGPLTDNPEWLHRRGQTPRGWKKGHLWDHARAGYILPMKGIFHGIDFGIERDYIGIEDSSLHEYGHCFDNLAGDYFYGRNISETSGFKRIIREEPFRHRDSHHEKYFTDPEEYMANSFEKYYMNDQTRLSLKENQLSIYRIISDLEEKISDDYDDYETRQQPLRGFLGRLFGGFRRR